MHRIARTGAAVAALVTALTSVDAFASEPKPVYIGLDGEFGFAGSTSAQAIRLGARIAADEVNRAGGVLGGRPLRLIEKDNRTLPARSRQNLREFAVVEDLVAVLCGRFSPTVIETIAEVHTLRIPLLDPWAAADGIIDHGFKPSYTFRLSLRDSWAMPVILDFLEKKGVRSVGLLFLNSSWGRSNEAAVRHETRSRPNLRVVGIRWFNNLERRDSMLKKYAELKQEGARGLILVANNAEASDLVKGIAALDPGERLPIAAHWGITGATFAEEVGADLGKVDLAVVQTYSFIGAKRAKAKPVIEAAKRLLQVDSERKIASPVGVAHAYDLVHILARAIDIAGSTDRAAVRDALEKVRNYSGLIQDYPQPFTPARHDALGREIVHMARYAADGALERAR